MKKSFYIENLGCSKNQVEAEIYGELLVREGLDWAEFPEDADVIIVNSCGFITPAKEETIDETLRFKSRFPEKKIVLAGCFAQRYSDTAAKELKDIDGIIGNQAPERIVPIVTGVLSGNRPVEIPDRDFSYPLRSRFLSFPGSVYVKIAEGCDNRCSYCAIPLIKGPLQSRQIKDISVEIAQYIGMGISEVILLAQDLASFGVDRSDASELIGLLEEIGKIQGDFWVRLLYIHPDHFSEELIKVCNSTLKVLPYFDIPFQHASEPILKQMGRSGNGGKYLELINKIRGEIPEAVIRSTFLVGFPGETDADFNTLLQFQESASIDWLGVFTYSREEGTRAASLQGELGYRFSKKKTEQRKTILEERQQRITTERLKRFVGSTQAVLVEEPVYGEALYIGRTYFQAPEVDGLTVIKSDNLVPGTFVECRITKVTSVDLEAVAIPVEAVLAVTPGA